MQSRSTSPKDPRQVSPVLFFPISSAISFKGPNTHIDVPSPTGPQIQPCHRVQDVHGVAEKRSESTRGRRDRERETEIDILI